MVDGGSRGGTAEGENGRGYDGISDGIAFTSVRMSGDSAEGEGEFSGDIVIRAILRRSPRLL